MQSVKVEALSTDDIFGHQNGLNFGVAFSAYDGVTEPILDEKYGKLVFNEYTWGENEDGSFFVNYNPIPSHTCSPDELGLTEDRSQANFFPFNE